ncbi:MAG: hypothetical protein L0Y58_08180 [Verrucomicrobia subdivision 3 bacterium]|nr:hypothetical protein [Limisphaerales bacterium]
MRKRILIGLLLIVAIGIATWLLSLSGPKRGTVEWHKREYLAAWNAVTQREGSPRFLRWLREKTHTTEAAELLFRKMASNRVALVKLGYLLERRFAVRSGQGFDVSRKVLNAWAMSNDEMVKSFNWMQVYTNSIVVTAPTEWMAQWEELIRKADVPKQERE